MTQETGNQVYALARWAGCSDAQAIIMTAIAKCESDWNTAATGDLNLSPYGSVGSWQEFTKVWSPASLHVGSGPWTPALVAELRDPFKNATGMFVILKAQGYTAWSTYNNGCYKGNLATARAASKTVGSNWPQWLPGAVVVAPAPTPAPAPSPGPTPTPLPVGGPVNINPKDRLRLRGNKNPKAITSLVNAQLQHVTASQNWHDLCLKFVRTVLGVGAKAPRAIDAWNAAGSSHQHGYYNPPAGVPVFWSGGSSGAGHIALADGKGNVWSSDIRRSGQVDLVPISEIHAKWGLTLLGWTDTLNGVSVYS